MRLTKLAPGQHRYYLDAVDAGEAAGAWVGAASPALGLSGRLDPAPFVSVLAGGDPETGRYLGPARRRVPGFDLTFLAPKSVSVLGGLAEPEVRGEVELGHAAAVAGALGYLEREAARALRGSGVSRRQVRAAGFVGGAFLHRTSRAADPLLHTHVVVANLALGEDGAWSALDARPLYAHVQAAGHLYHAALREELGRRLGVAWGPVRHGVAQVEGIEDPVLRAFSSRRIEVEGRLAEVGASGPRAARVAALDTRPGSPPDRRLAGVLALWRERAEGLGLGPAELAATVGRPGPGTRLGAAPERVVAAAEESSPGGGFRRRDLVRAWCEHLPVGASVTSVEALAHGVLNSSLVVVRLSGREPRWCSPQALALEYRVGQESARRRSAGWAVADRAPLEAALAERGALGAAEVEAVRRLALSGSGVEVLLTPVGLGRTTVLDGARGAWEATGLQVLGTAPTRRSAAELEATSGILSAPISGVVGRSIPAGAVVVVDDAGRAQPADLARLIDAAGPVGAKVVLVADPWAQGLVGEVAKRVGAVELGPVVRGGARVPLPHPAAVASVRIAVGDGEVWLSATADGARDALVGRWLEARGAGRSVVMVAGRRSDAEDLNRRARARLGVAEGGDHAPASGRGPAYALTPFGLGRTPVELVLVLGDDVALAEARYRGFGVAGTRHERHVVGFGAPGMESPDRLERAAVGAAGAAAAVNRSGSPASPGRAPAPDAAVPLSRSGPERDALARALAPGLAPEVAGGRAHLAAERARIEWALGWGRP
ncbi:MAG: MobF family relaxase, partial [Acidimicrobiales bacterium]